MYSHTYINTGFTQLSRIRSAFADAKRLSDTEPHQSAIFAPQPKTSPRGEKPAQDGRARSGGVHKKDHGTENAAKWGRGALGIGQGRLRARHAIVPTARRSMGAAFQQIHFSQHPVSLADSLRAGQACGQGVRCCNCTTPCPSHINALPAGRSRRCHGGQYCAAASEQKTVGDDYISDCGLFCCQFAACAEEEKMYCWKALSATPVTSMPACSCASRMALVVLPPKMPSALSSR